MKECTKCRETKTLEEFYRNHRRKDGRQTFCKKCASAHRAEWGRANKDKVQVYRLYDKYKLRPEEFEAMLEAQSNTCKLCPTVFTDTLDRHIDHDHSTGEVRGILCRRCNIMIGWYEAIPDHNAVLSYLGRV